MAGYGNRTAPDYLAEDLQEEHANTRLGLHDSKTPYSAGHPEHGSGTTGGAGFGNKRSSFSKSDAEEEETRFGVHKNTAPYSNATQHGSGTTGGAGFGNKTGEYSESSDSTMGKIMEKAGHMMHNEKMAEKGRVKREDAGFGAQVEQ